MGNGNPFYRKIFIQNASIFYIVTSSQANLIYRRDICCTKPSWAQQNLVCPNWLDKTNLWSLSTCEKYFKLYNYLTMNLTINNGNIGKFYNSMYRRYVGLIVRVFDVWQERCSSASGRLWSVFHSVLAQRLVLPRLPVCSCARHWLREPLIRVVPNLFREVQVL